MPEKLQTKENHARLDPAFHLVLLPGLTVVFLWTLVHAVKRPGTENIVQLLLSGLVLLLAFKARLYALKVQDRVIRLEEQLRFAALAPASLQARAGELTESQWIALRFASSSELPALAERTLNEKLTNKQIKQSIKEWRPDYWRV